MNKIISKTNKLTNKFGQRQVAIVILLILEIILFSIITDYFFTLSNFNSIISSSIDLAIVSIGMTLVILMGGIDVSIGSILGVIAIVIGKLLIMGVHPILVILAAIATGIILGGFNGILIGYAGLPAIIVTLGTMNIWRAAIFGLLGGQWISGIPSTFYFLNESILGIPINLIIIIILYSFFWYLTKYRKFGRKIYAIGNNEESARLSGINVKKTFVLVYALMGILVAFAAFTYISRMGGVEITVKRVLPLKAIAAVVIGGSSITGGRGSVLGTLLGVLFINILQNGIILLGIPSLWERAIVGVLIIIAIATDLISTSESKEGTANEE